MERLTKRYNGLIDIGDEGSVTKCIQHLADYEDAEEQGLLVRMTEQLALAMCAGARAIKNNRRYAGTTYIYDVFGDSKQVTYYEAALLLRETAEKSIGGGAIDGEKDS